MPKDSNGHRFDFDRDVCQICGMTRTAWDDNGQPRCTGRRTEDEGPLRPQVMTVTPTRRS